MKLLFEVINVSKGIKILILWKLRRIFIYILDNSITEYQWRHFYEIFVIPFDECDTDKDMWLSDDELRICYTLETL